MGMTPFHLNLLTMKKITFFSLLMIFTFAVQAQSLSYFYNLDGETPFENNWNFYFKKYGFTTNGVWTLIYISNPEQDKGLAARDINTYSFKKGKRNTVADKESRMLIKNGYLTNYKFYKSGKLRYEYLFTYNPEGFYTSFRHLVKGKPHLREIVFYNDSNKVLRYESYNKKDKLKRLRIYEYQGLTKMAKITTYTKDTLVPFTEYRYIYYPDGKIKRTEFYKKGKLKSAWNHTCDESGIKEDMKDDKVKESNVCVLTEHKNDGSYVKIYRTTDEKGRVSEQRSYYNKDNLLIGSERVDHKGEIVFKSETVYNDKKQKVKYTRYKKGGKEIKWTWVYKYNEQGLKIEWTRSNGKGELVYRDVKKYDAQKRLLEEATYKKGKLKSKTTYRYDSAGRMTKKTIYNKSDEPKKEFEYSYTLAK